jgi:hypothetical protein
VIDLEKTRDRLLTKLNVETRVLKRYDDYFEGEQPLRFMSPALKMELGDRVAELVINLPRYGVEAYDTRLDVEGFRIRGSDSSDDELWSIYQQNEGDLLSQQTHQELLALGRAYQIVGPGEDAEVPLITAESAFDCMHEDDPRTHDIYAGVKRWTDPDKSRWVTLYTEENRTTWYRTKGPWTQDSQAEYDIKLNHLVPMMNQARMLGRFRPGKRDQRLGRSIFHDILPIVDALNKMATDMMVSGEFHAMPRRWATGLSSEDFTDEVGKAIDTWQLMVGRIWATENDKAKMGQFQEADLKVFHETIKLLMQIAAQLLALPPHYLGFSSVNPPSADAIRGSEVQLVKRAERLQTTLGGRHERVQRLILVEKTGKDLPAYRQIETLWRDPSTPTVAQKADATVKLVTAKDGDGRSIVPVQQAREDLGYTKAQQDRMDDWDQQNAIDPLTARAMRVLNTGGSGAGSTSVS